MSAQSAPRSRPVRSWPLLLLAAPAFVAIWSGWVGLGRMTGFGPVEPLPGIADGFVIDTAVTLPIGMEAYAAFALRAWLSDRLPDRARTFARRSAIGSLVLGASGQVAYHLLAAAGVTAAPWWITAAVACLPVAVLGMGATLAHLVAVAPDEDERPGAAPVMTGRVAVTSSRSGTGQDRVTGQGVTDRPAGDRPVSDGPVTGPRASDRPAVTGSPGRPVDRSPVTLTAAPTGQTTGGTAGQVDDLLVVGQAVAADLARTGQRLTRAALQAGVRDRGHTLSTQRAQTLLTAVRGLDRSA